jgi:hypothetical protein
MTYYDWFEPIASMFYDSLYDYDLSGWNIEPISTGVRTDRESLNQGQKRGWPFRTHNGKGQ